MFLMTAAAGMAAMFLQGAYGGGGLPGGSYQQSCRNANVASGRLWAECSDRSGRLRDTSIPLAMCVGRPIENIDGRLTCGDVRGAIDGEFARPGGQPNNRPGGQQNNRPGYGGSNYGNGPVGGGRPGPGGGYRGPPSIVVYADSEYRGRSTTFNSAVNHLGPTGFNDMITSFQVRGRWEVCTDPNFRGECFVYDYDESNVSTNRINDKISSLRPVR